MQEDIIVIVANIARYRELLRTCADEDQRRTIANLLDEMTQRLEQLTADQDEGEWPPR